MSRYMIPLMEFRGHHSICIILLTAARRSANIMHSVVRPVHMVAPLQSLRTNVMRVRDRLCAIG
jgi:hypothetical protein